MSTRVFMTGNIGAGSYLTRAIASLRNK
jgi:hypothetical protein